MSPYWAILQARYRVLLQYRAAALAGAATQFWWGFIKIMVLEAFYLSGGYEAPMSFGAVVTYVWLGQAFLAILPWNQDPELQSMIRDGNVGYELVRPVDLYSLWYARTLAMRAAPTSLRCVPIFFFSGFVMAQTSLVDWSLSAPASAAAAIAFVVALGCGLLVSVAITTLVHVSLIPNRTPASR
jgi:ABC-2 type transport system permease protein